tara:strand:+ start:710 stop:1801 length:1092 start_codon:yes stop_codon:yes gene_type:complete
MIPVYKPYLSDRTINLAKEALDEGWISSSGRFKTLASDLLCERTGSNYAYLTCNGTAACHAMFRVVREFHPSNMSMAVPNNCYVAAWNSLLFDGDYINITPIDADPNTWNMDVEDIPSTCDTIMVVHNLGNTINVPKIKKRRPEVLIIEDACEALFGSYNGKPVGSESLCSAFSFFGNKNVSSGEGGALVTNDEDVAEFVRHICEQGQTNKRFVHDMLAYNYRMSNIHAAILYGQLLDYDHIVEMKKEVFSNYDEMLSGLPIEVQTQEEDTSHSLWMYGIKLSSIEARDNVVSGLKSRGIETRPMFYPMSRHEHLSGIAIADDEEVATDLSERCIMLPSYPDLTKSDIRKISEVIKDSLDGNI